jgi:hypothetical protein
MAYLAEVRFEPTGQHIFIQLRDPKQGKLLKVDIAVLDVEIRITAAVNHRCMNHVVNNDAFYAWDPRSHYWDME